VEGGLQNFVIPHEVIEEFRNLHPLYPNDMAIGLQMAQDLNLASATITGMRTPSPYTADEVVDVSVRGFVVRRDFNAAMREVVTHPDEPQ
jgi:hypothetical protein